ncbi:MAG: hypothetical protein OXE58_13225 [Acidobacteria bacterium]|nr:hypothetical protein [Acidobacteriota bacterium]
MLYITDVLLIAILSGSLTVPSMRPLVELAREAGESVSIGQSRTELRELCYADAERELQECQEAGMENCAGVYEQDRRVCLVRSPLPPPVEEDGSSWVGWLLGFVVVAGIYIWVEAEAQEDEIY